jgi:predicted RNase H-like nuclease
MADPSFVGVDLAWGERNGTGLCVLCGGRVVDSARRVALDDIADWLRDHTSGDCIVAIDAPLIVSNLTGRRPCEALISGCFARYDAGAHSSNLSNPAFRDGGRAAALARCLGLDTDPAWDRTAPLRRAIEVYPHPALVVLFGLHKTLKYKARRGRTLATRKAAFETAAQHLESLVAADPPLHLRASHRWTDVMTEIRSATTSAALDRAENEFDAYVCAYVAAYYWRHGDARCRAVGDVETGYIVTPVSAEHGAWLDGASAKWQARDRSLGLG